MYTMRENYEAFLAHEETEWVPDFFTDIKTAGSDHELWENGDPAKDNYDEFGTKWVKVESAMGQGTPDANIIPLDDVCDWEDKVHFPDLDAIDWEAYRDQELAGYDRDAQVLEYHTWNSIFLRFSHLLGFEEALCAFYEEPEATHALLEAITDYKIRLVGYIDKYFKPDAICHYDDTATAKSLFMGPDVYREFIKPCHKRLNDAIRSYGIIPETHVCGYCTDIIPDMIDEGSAAWQSAQPCNDIAAIIEQYGDRISVVGGYDSQGAPGQPDATPAIVDAEVKRCMEEYGRFGHSFACWAIVLGSMSDPHIQECLGAGIQAMTKYGHEIPAQLRAEGKLPPLPEKPAHEA